MIMHGSILSLLLFLSINLFAQEKQSDYSTYASKKLFSEIEIYVGPGIGFLRGNASVDNSEFNKRKVKITYAYGIGLNHNINDRLSLNNKLFFERKGGVSELTGTYFDESTKTYKKGISEHDYSFNYYTLDISAAYKLGKRKKLSIGCGPYLSYLKKHTHKQITFFRGSGAFFDETEHYRKFDFGVSMLIGYHIPVSPKVQLNVRLINALGLVHTGLNFYEGQVMKTNNTALLIGFTSKRKVLK
jgi:hypothetical protein